MILYLDTSCLAKLYLEESGSEQVQGAVAAAEEVATSMVAEAEVRSASARRRREGLASALSIVDAEDGETWFYSADAKLNAAAKREGLKKLFHADLS